MAISEYNDSGKQGENGVQRGITEALLRTEIGFWREMIASCGESESPDSIERMRHALALAEMRLGQLRAYQPCNVFHIDTARREAT